MKISVVFLIKDSEQYCLYLNYLFSELEKNKKYSFEYFIYENDSDYLTKKNLCEFMKKREGMIITVNSGKNKSNMVGVSQKRGNHMCKLRNLLKKHHDILTSDYTLIIDSDVVFHPNTIDRMMNIFKKNKDIAVVTPFCICYDWYKKKNDTNHYYDSLAVINKGGEITQDKHCNTCLFKTCKRCPSIREKKKVKISENKLFSIDKNNINQHIEVDSAFGGFFLIKTKIYNKVKWENTICEHHGLCKNIRKFGKIIIAPNIKTCITVPKYSTINNFLKISLLLDKFY